ncbi:adenosine kinase [Aurantimonas sp. A3-2-R12]|uniref:adenosine kinase n=1 Tax=Aurantimonas sp. A3-2-R12 TaxID=3114362 RepID=UPI002E16BCA7|nr:adenosine kinase [Aurantimonas sp. A3-2-R12]
MAALPTLLPIWRMWGWPAALSAKPPRDQFGKVFASDLRSIGIDHCVMPATDGEGTGRCLVLITPDGERTMCTFLGASVSLDATDVVASMPKRFGTVLIEGYLWDAPHGPAVIDAALDCADAADARIAVTLSDPGCVERHLDEIRGFVDQYCDILLANEAEAYVLAGESDLEAMLDHVAENVPLAVVTRSERGSVIVSNSTRFWTPAVPVDSLVDTTGAGDAYAAGFLAALLKGASPAEAGTAGAVLAARVIGHFSARQKPQLFPCPVGSTRTGDDTIIARAQGVNALRQSQYGKTKT